jgi:MoxR-like ATPase
MIDLGTLATLDGVSLRKAAVLEGVAYAFTLPVDVRADGTVIRWRWLGRSKLLQRIGEVRAGSYKWSHKDKAAIERGLPPPESGPEMKGSGDVEPDDSPPPAPDSTPTPNPAPDLATPPKPKDLATAESALTNLVGILVAEVERRVSGKVDEATVERLINERMKGFEVGYRGIEIKTSDAPPKKVEGKTHKSLKEVLERVKIGENVLLVGPMGCGKTTLAQQVSQALGLEYSLTSWTEGVTESVIEGWLLPVGEGGRFEYVPCPYVLRYEGGGLHVHDEIDRGNANTTCALNASLANGHMTVAKRYKNPIISRHEKFRCIATANTFMNGMSLEYAGANKLDGAFADRWRNGIVYMDYDESLEKELIHPDVLKWGYAVREQLKKHSIRRFMSTRVLVGYTRELELLGWGKDKWEASYFADWKAEERAKIKT